MQGQSSVSVFGLKNGLQYCIKNILPLVLKPLFKTFLGNLKQALFNLTISGSSNTSQSLSSFNIADSNGGNSYSL